MANICLKSFLLFLETLEKLIKTMMKWFFMPIRFVKTDKSENFSVGEDLGQGNIHTLLVGL